MALRCSPRWIAEAIGCLGAAAIVVAIAMLDATMAYPSWRAALPVAGAALAILAGVAQPRIVVARLLALRPMVGIGLVSYGWYLWHWPILSFIRISRLGQPSLPGIRGNDFLHPYSRKHAAPPRVPARREASPPRRRTSQVFGVRARRRAPGRPGVEAARRYRRLRRGSGG